MPMLLVINQVIIWPQITSNAYPETPMRVDIGNDTYEFPSDTLKPLRDCNNLLDDVQALHARMAEDGYLLVRKLIDRDAVMTARHAVFDYMAAKCPELFKEGTDPHEAMHSAAGKHVQLMGNKDITHCDAMRRVLEGPELFGFFEKYFQEAARTFDYKWLRAVQPGGHSGAHYDFVYMGRGSARLLTTWIPMGDITPDLGALTACVGSHNEPGFEKLRNTYGRMDVDNNGSAQGWFTNDPKEVTKKFGGCWATSAFEAGDVMLFGMHTMHMGTTNLTDRWRLSCDVRFQPAADPVDERWVGENPIAHYARHDDSPTMEEARAKWGV